MIEILVMTKVQVGLLFGGNSGEHEVSITSARAIIKALTCGSNMNKYDVKPFYIQKNGVWQTGEIPQQVLDSGFALQSQSSQLWNLPSTASDMDVWFPVVHGPNGEDGTIQGLLTLMQVPFVGSGVLGSAVGMDKIAMKTAFAQAGLPQVKYMTITQSNIGSNPCILPKLYDDIDKNLGYPCFVKPANLGSSVGITKVYERQELEPALNKAASYNHRIIIEAGVIARELECAILGNANPRASVIGEINYNSEFYDYEAKYTYGHSQLIIPAKIDDVINQKVQEMALQAFTAVNALGLSRVDFFYLEDTKDILINEINTLPGFSPFSMYPQLWAHSGVAFPELLDILIQLALEKEFASKLD